MSFKDEGMLRDVTREVLAELLPGLLSEALATPATNGNGHGHRAQPSVSVAEGEPVVPQVPAPPLARVHRPSGWVAPALAETVRESPAPKSVPDGVAVERVTLRSDADLDAFVRMLARRLENPLDRAAIVSGRLRFQLAATSAESGPAVPVLRIEKGAVTERAVKEAARAGARLVLSARAVLTPMARDRARSLGVDIEKESPC
jgi:hypothetical protein